MKRTMQYIVAMAAVLWMAIPQVKAQELKEDHDPGIMYVMRNEDMHIPFEEGNEWEITFTAIDTLGNEYYSPVGMEIKGGVDNDSIYVVMQTVDSILMYQPAPVMQPGVFVITEEYFPYIAQVDSNTTIHFNVGIPLALPVVGQKVVCNIFEEPLRVGFVGTVLEMNQSATEIVMVCDPKIERLKDFYQHIIYSGGGGRTEEYEEQVREISKVQRIRRGIVVEPLRAKAEEVQDWEADFKLVEPLNLSFKKDFKAGPFDGEVGLNFSGEFGFKANVNVFVSGVEKRGIRFTTYIKPQGSFEVKVGGNAALPIPGVGWTIQDISCPFSTSLDNGLAGLYLYAEGSIALNVSLGYSEFKGNFSYLENPETEEYEFARGGSVSGPEWDNITLTLAALAAFRAGVEAEAKAFGHDVSVKLYINLIEASGQLKMTLVDAGGNDNPSIEDLLNAYKSYDNDNYVKISTGVRAGFEIKKDSKDEDSNGPYVDSNVGVTLEHDYMSWQASPSPSIDRESPLNECKILSSYSGNDREAEIAVRGATPSLMPADFYMWAYDVNSKEWYSKTKIGKIGCLETLTGQKGKIPLRMGRTYDLYPVYDLVAVSDNISDGVFKQGVYVPYYVEIRDPIMENHETVTLKAQICKAATDDMDENTVIGFEYKESTSDTWTNVVAELDGQNLSAVIENPGYEIAYNHQVRAYYKKDNKTSYSDVKTFTPLDSRTPITLDATEVSYSSATLNAEISADLSGQEHWLVGFEYENTATGVVKTIEGNCAGIIGIFSLTATELEPSTTYTVKAYARISDSKRYSKESKTFTTPAPIYDLKAEAGYNTEDKFYATLTATVLKRIYDNHQDMKFYVAKDKNKLAETDITGLDVQDILEIDDEMLVSFKAKELEQNTTYYYRVGTIYYDQELGTSKEITSETAQFKTSDGYGITLKDAVVKSNTATVEATVSQYIVDEVNRGNPYTIRFYYDTSSSKVKNRTSQFVEASISSTKVKATIKDLEEETKYYYAAVLYMIEEKGASEVKSFTTPTIFQIETKDAVVEDAMVTLKATISDAALAEMKSENYNTIYAAFDLVTKEHESDLKQGTASANVTRITDLTQDGVNISVDVYLEPGTEYCYRALIYVDGKEYYGATKTFKTLEYDGGLIPLVRKYRPDASAPWVPIVVKPEEKHLATPLKELIKE